MNTMLTRKHKTSFTILKRTVSEPDEGGSTTVSFIPQEPVSGVVTRLGTTDDELFHSNILTRQKRIRAFMEVDVSYNDKILLDGEEWDIAGEPEAIRSTRNKKVTSTVINITKEGKGGTR